MHASLLYTWIEKNPSIRFEFDSIHSFRSTLEEYKHGIYYYYYYFLTNVPPTMKSIIIASSLMMASAAAFAPIAMQQQQQQQYVSFISLSATAFATELVDNTPFDSKIHPKWYPSTTIMCDGKPLGLIGSTKKQLQVDMWLANHPFYTKNQIMVDSEGRVERFMKKYGLQNPTDDE